MLMMMLLLSPPQSYPHSVPFPGEAPALPVQPRRIPLRSTDRDCHIIITFTFFPRYHLPNLHSTKSHKSHSPPFSRPSHFCLPPPSSTLDPNPPQQPNDTQPCNHNSTDAFHVSAESPQWARTHHRTMISPDGFEARLCYDHATRDADPSLAVLANSVGR